MSFPSSDRKLAFKSGTIRLLVGRRDVLPISVGSISGDIHIEDLRIPGYPFLVFHATSIQIHAGSVNITGIYPGFWAHTNLVCGVTSADQYLAFYRRIQNWTIGTQPDRNQDISSERGRQWIYPSGYKCPDNKLVFVATHGGSENADKYVSMVEFLIMYDGFYREGIPEQF